MKKIFFIFLFVSFTSLMAAAGNDIIASPGDPKKEQEKQPKFALAKGYFMLFNIISTNTAVVDTSRILSTPGIQQPANSNKP